MMSGKLSLVVTSTDFNVLTMEETVQILVADSVLVHLIVLIRYFQAHVLDHTLHFILADELIG